MDTADYMPHHIRREWCGFVMNEYDIGVSLLDRLERERTLTTDEYLWLIDHRSDALAACAAERAVAVRKAVYDTDVYIRGLIEIGNICKNNCLYCGIRAGNQTCDRYRLTKEQILDACAEGYAIGFRTFVLQGGEDPHFTEAWVCDVVRAVKAAYPDCAVTLSLGEYPRETYAAFREAGADRYLLRHETADAAHYEKLHTPHQRFEERMRCLRDLKELGFQVGCGFMVGSPYQTSTMLAKDLKFIEEFKPDMCGIGPFIPHHATPFADFKAGTLEQTTYLLSLIRLIHPSVLLPATTALGTIHPQGREKGILAGANVIMPNLSPRDHRPKYELYDNKLHTDAEAAENRRLLEEQIAAIGYRVVTARGDVKNGLQ